MIKIDYLSSIEGRKLLKDLFYELKYKKQYNSIIVISILWRICTTEKNISKYSSNEILVEYPLGILKGTWLWMEEVINRYFFSTINSFVYLGAAILLVLIGLRRFSDLLTDQIVIAGVIFEATMLLLMFIVMLFTPDEDVVSEKIEQDNDTKTLVNEIGEIATDFAASNLKIEEMNNKLEKLINLQKELLLMSGEIIENISQTISPNRKMLENMEKTNHQIEILNYNFTKINETLDQLKKEEIELTVKKELEKIILNRVNSEK